MDLIYNVNAEMLKRFNRFAELEQENAALKNEIVNLKGVIESLSEQRDGLEKENAELKERLERAKEIIKDFVDRDDSCWSIQKRAEEFLKECE